MVDDFLGGLSGQPSLVLPLVFGERRQDDELVEPVVEHPPALAILEELSEGSQTALDRRRRLECGLFVEVVLELVECLGLDGPEVLDAAFRAELLEVPESVPVGCDGVRLEVPGVVEVELDDVVERDS